MYDMKKKYTVLILISFAMGVIFSRNRRDGLGTQPLL